MVTNRNNEREVRAEITKPEIKLLKSGKLPAATAEVPSAGSRNGGSGSIVDQTKKGINFQPQISASIKQRHPLRFFPEVLPVNSRYLRKGLTILLNEKGQRRVEWTSQRKEKMGEQWVPRVKTHIEAWDHRRHVWALRHGPVILWGLLLIPPLKWGPQVGPSSGANTMPGPHDKLNELKGDGLDPKGLGYQVEVGSTGIDHALSADEILGSGDTLMVRRSTAASRLDWESVDMILRASRCEFSNVPIKVRFLTAPIFPSLLFSCHFKREGFGVRLLGLYGGDSRVESEGALVLMGHSVRRNGPWLITVEMILLMLLRYVWSLV
ncbi:hypothetical protein FCV25MIE_09516 [Fagus crenata]